MLISIETHITCDFPGGGGRGGGFRTPYPPMGNQSIVCLSVSCLLSVCPSASSSKSLICLTHTCCLRLELVQTVEIGLNQYLILRRNLGDNYSKFSFGEVYRQMYGQKFSFTGTRLQSPQT